MINSSSNLKIKNIIKLQNKSKIRKEQDVFIIEGIKMFLEIEQENLVDTYISEKFYNEKVNKDDEILKDIQYEVVSDNIFESISDTVTPQGILAIVKRPHYKIEDILNNDNASLMFLENLRDPGNLGTIIRTSEGAGITGVIISQESVDIFNPKVIRSTMGSIYRVPFVYVEDIKEVAIEAKKQGILLYAAHLNGDKDYDREDYTSKCGILIGNEAMGLSQELSNIADTLVKIPMEGKVESLNASIAAAVFMYEVYRQRRL